MTFQQLHKEKLPKCGFGLTGLCCQACLAGPCRVHPLELENSRLDCGMAPDVLVAFHLFRLLTGAAMEKTGDLLSDITQLGTENAERLCRDQAVWKPVAQKYLDRQPHDVGRLAEQLKSWAEQMLFPQISPGKVTAEIDRLYTGRSFPVLNHPKIRLMKPLMQDLFETANAATPDGGSIVTILWASLKMANIAMVATDISEDIRLVLDPGEYSAGQESKGAEAGAVLSDGSFSETPLVVIDSASSETLGSSIHHFQYKPPFSFTAIHSGRILQDILRIGCRNKPPVIVFSSSPAVVLMPLLLGFNTTSFPPLPLYGSKDVEDFFLSALSQDIGASYIPSNTPDMAAALKSLWGLDR